MDKELETKLLGWYGRPVTWKLLAEVGITRPDAKDDATARLAPCKRCLRELPRYAKGFCRSCYQNNRYSLPKQSCSTCGSVAAPIAQIPGTGQFCCSKHDTQAKREAFDKSDTVTHPV